MRTLNLFAEGRPVLVKGLQMGPCAVSARGSSVLLPSPTYLRPPPPPPGQVVAQAYDNPIPGFKTPTTTNLRLWDALPKEEFDLTAFNAGEYSQVLLLLKYTTPEIRGPYGRGVQEGTPRHCSSCVPAPPLACSPLQSVFIPATPLPATAVSLYLPPPCLTVLRGFANTFNHS